MKESDSIEVTVRVTPRSSQGPRIEVDDDGQLRAYVPEAPADGKATKAVVRLLAQHFGVAKSYVDLLSGANSRIKRFRITGKS